MNRAIALDPDNADYHLALGRIFTNPPPGVAHELSAAMDSFTRAVHLQPEGAIAIEAFINAGQICELFQTPPDFASAVDLYQSAIDTAERARYRIASGRMDPSELSENVVAEAHHRVASARRKLSDEEQQQEVHPAIDVHPFTIAFGPRLLTSCAAWGHLRCAASPQRTAFATSPSATYLSGFSFLSTSPFDSALCLSSTD